MILHDFSLPRYDWNVRVYYIIDKPRLSPIAEDLAALEPSHDEMAEAMESIKENIPNTGYIFSNTKMRKTLIVIGRTTSAEEFQDTFDHEKGHLAMHICIEENIDPFSEEYQYLVGEIGHRMFKVAKRFMCDSCREMFE